MDGVVVMVDSGRGSALENWAGRHWSVYLRQTVDKMVENVVDDDERCSGTGRTARSRLGVAMRTGVSKWDAFCSGWRREVKKRKWDGSGHTSFIPLFAALFGP